MPFIACQIRVDRVVRLVRIPLQVRQCLHPVLCSSLAVAASNFVHASNNRLQNEHEPILYTVILLREHWLILHSAYVILSEHELLFSKHVIPHSAHAILLSEHGPQNGSISSSLPKKPALADATFGLGYSYSKLCL